MVSGDLGDRWAHVTPDPANSHNQDFVIVQLLNVEEHHVGEEKTE